MKPDEPVLGRPTLRQVAALSGVSLKTASRVLNGEQYVAEATAAKVRAAAAQLGFRLNVIARELRAGARSTSVGLIIGDVSNPFYSRIARGAERRLRVEGLQLITASSDEDPQLEHTLVSGMLERRVSAMLIVTSATDHAYLEVERRLGMPVAFVDRPPTDIVADTIVLDNTAGAQQAVEHLLRQKHRRIGLVGDLSRLSTHRERVAAFENAMTAAGIANWRKYVRSDSHDVATAERAVRELLDLVPAPTALFTTNNRITIGALRALRDRPDPPALVGFDDFDLADVLGTTVVAHDMTAIGREAARLAHQRISGFTGPARTIVMATSIIARGSGERPPR
jgi:LacI family transcriptional regulator